MTRYGPLLALALAALVSVSPGQGAGAKGKAVSDRNPSPHAAWDGILRRHVVDGLVDYDGIAKHDRRALRSYLASLARVDHGDLSPDDLFAYGINLYNATMVEAVIEKRAEDPTWLPPKNDFGVFKEKRVAIKGRTITLDDLEHRILRPRMKDHRIHVALVCGARSCPPLLPRAYVGRDLNEILDSNWKAFLANEKLNRVDREMKVLRLSSLFDWFSDDFGGEKGIRRLIARSFGDEVAKFRIEYSPYDWKLNAVPKTEKAKR